MKNYQEFNVLLEGEKFGVLNEAGLSRLLSMVNTSDFCIATAWRDSNSNAENRKLNQDLLKKLAVKKMGGYKLIGHWEETKDGVNWKDASDEDKVDVVENSILFTRNDDIMTREGFIDFCVGLCRIYNQDAVLIGLQDDGYYLYYSDGTRDKIGDDLTLNKTAQAWSVLRNKRNVPFIFEGVLQPSNNMGRMAFDRNNMLWVS